MSHLVSAKEPDSYDSVALWREVEVVDPIGDNLSPEVDRVLLPERLLVTDLVHSEVQLAAVDGH